LQSKTYKSIRSLRFNEIETGSKFLIWRVFSSREPVSAPHRVRGRLSLENAIMHAQNPSSARLTQLTANIEPTIAAADANVAMVFTDRMTNTLDTQKLNDPTLFDNPRSIMARFLPDK
jgi:hypothetical protein